MDKTQFNPQDPNALFSPDQWLNQFSNYNSKALPWPSTFYTGTPAGSMPPTDAMGKPIQSFLDMQAKHDAWNLANPATSASTPMGTDPNFALENQWLAANHQPVQLAPTQTPGVLGPQTQAALQAMNAASGAAGASGTQGAQAVPGTTLNSTPQSSTPAQASSLTLDSNGQVSPYNIAPGNSAIDAGNTSAGLKALNSLIPSGNNSFTAGPGTPQGFWQSKQPQAQTSQAAGTNPFDMHQAYLDALSNPGKVTTPGATVLESAGAQPGSANLQSFLQNWRPAQSGPGSGFQQNFASALKGMGY